MIFLKKVCFSRTVEQSWGNLDVYKSDAEHQKCLTLEKLSLNPKNVATVTVQAM